MLIPACPNAGPSGGAGVALPAGTCSFNCFSIFFAMLEIVMNDASVP